MYPKLDYNIETDLVPLTIIANPPQVIVVNPTRVKADNFKDFLDFVRKNPGKLNYASAGNGTSHHLAGELFKMQSKTFIIHIPYRGAGPALNDLLAGQVDMMFDGLGSSAQHITSGPHQGACDRVAEALAGISQCADHRRGRHARLRGLDLVRHLGRQRARRRTFSTACTPKS